MEEEVWLPVIGYEEMYEVSNMGRIRSRYKNTCKDKSGIRKYIKTAKGYLKVKFKRNNLVRKYFVHRIVAQAFIPNPYNKPGINHKNGIKTDNRASELEWATAEENNNHAMSIGLNKPLSKPILDISTMIAYSSKGKALKALKISNKTLTNILNKKKEGTLIELHNNT